MNRVKNFLLLANAILFALNFTSCIKEEIDFKQASQSNTIQPDAGAEDRVPSCNCQVMVNSLTNAEGWIVSATKPDESYYFYLENDPCSMGGIDAQTGVWYNFYNLIGWHTNFDVNFSSYIIPEGKTCADYLAVAGSKKGEICEFTPLGTANISIRCRPNPSANWNMVTFSVNSNETYCTETGSLNVGVSNCTPVLNE